MRIRNALAASGRFSSRFPFTAIALVALCSPSIGLAAGVAHVEKHGNDNGACDRAAPCLTIQHAINLVGKSGRVLVGPGRYVETLNIEFDGLSLVSTRGRTTTQIDITELPFSGQPTIGGQIIRVNADGVTIGQKGRGFTLKHRLSESGIVGYGDRLRVEDNLINLLDGNFGIALFGDNLTVRYNDIHAVQRCTGIHLARPVPNSAGGRNWTVTDNSVSNCMESFFFRSTISNHRLRNENNSAHNTGYAFYVFNSVIVDGKEIANPGRSGDRHTNLVATGFDGQAAAAFQFVGGNPKIDNLSVAGVGREDIGITLSRTQGAKVSNFSTTTTPGQGQYSWGIGLSRADGTVITNASVLGHAAAVRFSESRGLRVRGSNLTGYERCAIEVEEDSLSSSAIVFAKNFWGSANGPVVTCSDDFLRLLNFARARLNPISQIN